MRSPVACLALVVAACGAPARTPPPRHPPPAVAPRTPPPNPGGPTEAECDTLYTHAFELAIQARPTAPPEADRAALRAELRPAFVADCRGGSRAYHQCGLAAKSAADLEACR